MHSFSLIAANGAIALLALSAPASASTSCEEGHVVGTGDTLYAVARRCSVGLSALIRANPFISNIHALQPGWRLEMPGATAASPDIEDPTELPGVYRVRRGDTLYSIARRNRVSLTALVALNPGLDVNNIEIGEPLRMPAGGPSRGARAAAGAGPRPDCPEPEANNGMDGRWEVGVERRPSR